MSNTWSSQSLTWIHRRNHGQEIRQDSVSHSRKRSWKVSCQSSFVLTTYVCHGSRLTNRTDYLQVTFDNICNILKERQSNHYSYYFLNILKSVSQTFNFLMTTRSAALGLAIAAAVGFSYSNIFVTSPSPENLHTLFEFIFKGFDAMGYEEHTDYDLVQSTNPEFHNAVVRVNIHEKNNHRQTIQVRWCLYIKRLLESIKLLKLI